ncbi:TonB-dependent receptor (plasmid) [Novosphingobium pentaromativorans US6-1]|uniref:TonB-dependent receptor n=1 Tax=Novosphingobium pentaromativorans US6-1 TaxID=1088721 RepID=G6EGB9_9SPHN|nr:TonB-dependent receptor [Novosphingobium pentaromativorans US6-1]EHJ59808.1 TonB-dependent receptor [Novosphingobium pentaromativorans US6-1]
MTAQKRIESAQKVPISIQSFGVAKLAEISASKLQDIEVAAPSLSFGDGSEQGRAGIRGVIDYSRNAGYDSRVGLYIDGVYFSRSWMMNQTLLGIKQMDVLRGPQGTLFGKNTDAGAISITTRQPSYETNGEFEAEYGRFGHWKVVGRVNVPLGGDAALQLSATHLEGKGYYHNDYLGTRNQGVNSEAVRAQLLIEPATGVRINIAGDYVDDHNSTLHYTYVPTPGTNPHHFNSYYDDRADRKMGGVSITGEVELGDGYNLTSISAFRSGKQDIDFSNETGTVPYLTVHFKPSTDQFTQELRIASPVGEHFDYVAGLYYFWGRNVDRNIAAFGSGLAYFGYPYTLYAGTDLPSYTSVSTKSYAGFVNANYRFNDVIELFVGGRLTHEKKTLDNLTTSDPYGIFALPLDGYSQKFGDTFFTPKGGVNLHLSNDVLVFGAVGKGFKSGGFNTEGTSAATFAAGIDFKPETVVSYELGVKSQFLDRRARLNITGFYQKFDRYQVFTFVEVDFGGTKRLTSSLTNAGELVSKGVEVDATLVPVPGLTLSGNYTYNLSEFVSYPGGGGFFNGTLLDADGVQAPYAPRHKAYLSASYTTALGVGDLKLTGHLGYSKVSSQNFDPKVVNPLYRSAYLMAGYNVADANLTLASQSGDWSLSVWSKNLLNKNYVKFANLTALLGNRVVVYGEPRTIGATFHYAF